jgi:hypothetical protein
MAIILKTNDSENNFYQKIILDKCYINNDGLYVSTIVFRNKQERNKDKLRAKEIDVFAANYDKKINEIDNIVDEKVKINEVNLFAKVQEVARNIFSRIYIGPLESLADRVPFQEDFLIEAEKYGFKREWYEDPIVIVREDLIRLDSYKKQDFNLASFYEILKQNIYTDEKGNILVEDDF